MAQNSAYNDVRDAHIEHISKAEGAELSKAYEEHSGSPAAGDAAFMKFSMTHPKAAAIRKHYETGRKAMMRDYGSATMSQEIGSYTKPFKDQSATVAALDAQWGPKDRAKHPNRRKF